MQTSLKSKVENETEAGQIWTCIPLAPQVFMLWAHSFLLFSSFQCISCHINISWKKSWLKENLSLPSIPKIWKEWKETLPTENLVFLCIIYTRTMQISETRDNPVITLLSLPDCPAFWKFTSRQCRAQLAFATKKRCLQMYSCMYKFVQVSLKLNFISFMKFRLMS